MRVKQLWDYVPLPAKLKLLVDRITFSRLTLFYFVFAVVHCIIQVVFQVQAFNINLGAARFLGDIIKKGNATEAGFMVLDEDLRLCDTVPVPAKIDASSCKLVWDGKSANSSESTLSGLAAQNVADGISNSASSAVSSSASSSSLASPGSDSSSLASSSASSSAVTASTSAAVSSASQATQTSSASHKSTVTVTVRPTITNLSQFNSDVALTTVRATHTVTVTTKPTSSAPVDSGDDDDDEDDGEDDDENEDILHVHKRATVVLAATSNGSNVVQIDGLPGIGSVTLSQTCLRALNWPVSKVENTKREDIVFVGFSIWVLGMSAVAILNESPPHVVASFLTHVLATAWAGYQLANTNSFHKQFSRLSTNGACGVNLLPTYWTERAKFEIPTLAMNALALIISSVLSWRLLKQFGWQTFKKIGASLTMSRAYRIILIFSIVLQLSLFFVVVAVALWIDQIYNGDIGKLTTRSEAFRAIDITILIVVLPWLIAGWISVRREYRIPMIVFLVLSILYLVGWASMFAAPTFRWTFVEWRFFSLMASASVALSSSLFVLGIMCRMNFGKGLPRYLKSQDSLPGDDFEPANFTYEKFDEKFDEEKINFPSYETPIPTFAAAYGDDLVAPPPAHVPLGSRVLGPRFFNQSQEIQMQRPTLSVIPPRDKSHLARQDSGSSMRSGSSTWSGSPSSTEDMRGKRWVIE